MEWLNFVYKCDIFYLLIEWWLLIEIVRANIVSKTKLY